MAASIKILLVEDETSVRRMLAEVLVNVGCKVKEARDGRESLEQLAQDEFDLVITDLSMPKMDGLSMLKLMEKTGRKEKVIVMSGYPSDEWSLTSGMAMVKARLLKPFNIDLFLEAVAAVAAGKTWGSSMSRQQQQVA